MCTTERQKPSLRVNNLRGMLKSFRGSYCSDSNILFYHLNYNNSRVESGFPVISPLTKGNYGNRKLYENYIILKSASISPNLNEIPLKKI